MDQLPNILGDRNLAREAEPVFVANGFAGSQPVTAETYLNAAYFRGDAFISGTTTVTLGAAEMLQFELFNPIGSGKIFDLVYRRFVNDRQGVDPVMKRGAVRTTTRLLGDDRPIAPMNRDANVTKPSVAQATRLSGAITPIVATIGAPLPLNGISDTLTLFSSITPGGGILYEIECSEVSPTETALAEMTFCWVERDYEAP